MAGLRIALVTGGMGGLGEVICTKLAALASDEAAFLTGANIAINGGQHMF